jgi:hypothetical protein
MNNITDIIPPSRRRAMDMEMNAGKEMPDLESPPPPRPLQDRPVLPPRPLRSARTFPYGTAVFTLLVIVVAGVVLYKFGGAKVTITPTENDATITGDFTATLSGGSLPFEIITVEKTAGTPLKSEGTEVANEPAQGSIVIENAQPTPQTLIKNTRFETSDGLIFRIHDSVTIPAGSVSSPGKLSVIAYADAGGDSYNVGPTNFTVPGLKGSKAFTLVTAKSSSPMTGGFSGTRATVSQAIRETQATKNKEALETSLKEGLAEKIPSGYVLVPGATFTTYSDIPDQIEKDMVTVSLKGTATAIVFPQSALAKAIADKSVGSYGGEPISITDASRLALAPTVGLPAAGETSFAFSLSGNATLVWDIDPAKISSGVAGKSRDAAQTVISTFPEVASATLLVRPFWKTTFPEDPKDITISTTTATK